MARFYYLLLLLASFLLSCKPEEDFDADFIREQLHGGSEKAWMVPLDYNGRPCAAARPDTGIVIFKSDGSVDIRLFSSSSVTPDCQRVISYSLQEVKASRTGAEVYLDLIAPIIGGGTNTTTFAIKIFDDGKFMTMNNGSKVLNAYALDEIVQTPLVNPATCFNGVLDPGEINIDCDGLCSPCSQLAVNSLSAGAFDGARLYLLDGSNASIQIVNTNGVSAGLISGAGLNTPVDIGTSPRGLFVLDKGVSQVKLFNTSISTAAPVSSSTTLPANAVAMTVIPGPLVDTLYIAYQNSTTQFSIGKVVYDGTNWSNSTAIASSIAGQCRSLKAYHVGKLLVGISSTVPLVNKTEVYSSQGLLVSTVSSTESMVSSEELPLNNSLYFIYTNTQVVRRNSYAVVTGTISNIDEIVKSTFSSGGSDIPFPANASEVIVGTDELYVLDATRKKVLVFDLALNFKRQF